MSKDYKNTVFLPRTDFPMKAGLPKLEPDILARWAKIDLFRALREKSKGKPLFILHDGPPYANGHLHLGHALNKILKDVVVRSRQMMGYDAPYVPGWDCHGLPIEWKIEERYRAEGKDKDEIPVIEFRKECRDFAAHWVNVQREEFKRLGVTGDWDHPYSTMAFHAEAAIARELGKFLLDGSLYKGAKPVMWSVVEKTALAEAEVEYHDHVSTTIWVKFPVVQASDPALDGANVVIWTTTPWTIPGNRAVAFGPEFDYAVVEVTDAGASGLNRSGEKLVLLREQAEQVARDAGIAIKTIAVVKGEAMAGSILAHPLKNHPEANGGYDFPVPLLSGDFVTTDVGTGFVHMAPGHGEDDWRTCVANGIPVPDTVQPDGSFFPHVAIFAGQLVYAQGKNGKYYSPVAKPVIAALTACGTLLQHGKIEHSYPHSWRSKAPLIFRNTPQWFISLEKTNLREKALAAVAATKFYPDQGRNRIRSMVEGRPDWCVSRQRAWGVPITAFVNKKTGEPLRDAMVMERIVAAFEERGADAWYDTPPERFLGEGRDASDYDQVFDVLDVWFDSGSTHAFVLEGDEWPGQRSPADLYLEGSDQHRGWFQSSLLESCGTRGRAPYEAVLTHGFILDEEGRKMSKSLGNGVEPQEEIDSKGADILRLWVTGADYSEDLRIGQTVLKTQVDVYRRLRNTLRYLLGALDGFEESERLPYEEMPELERWVLHRVAEINKGLWTACENYAFHVWYADLHVFCGVDLSAFYFDVRKDSLYCDDKNSIRRRAQRTVMDILLDSLCKWLAPFACFTAEEAWLSRHPSETGSVHLETFPVVPNQWTDPALAEKWRKIRDLRRVVTGALEIERAAKRIGSNLQAAPTLYATEEQARLLDGVDMAEICITSALFLKIEPVPAGAFTLDDVPGAGLLFETAAGEKCDRCWRVLDDVGSHGHDGLCGRCASVVDGAQ